jgi:hypothetical protein
VSDTRCECCCHKTYRQTAASIHAEYQAIERILEAGRTDVALELVRDKLVEWASAK